MSFISGLKYPIKRRPFSISIMRVPVPGGVGGGGRPHATFLAKSVDETMAFSKLLAMISRLAGDDVELAVVVKVSDGRTLGGAAIDLDRLEGQFARNMRQSCRGSGLGMDSRTHSGDGKKEQDSFHG